MLNHNISLKDSISSNVIDVFFCRANKEICENKQKHASEIAKMQALIKRMEIKNAALSHTVDQKTRECAELAALCDEVTGQVDHD